DAVPLQEVEMQITDAKAAYPIVGSVVGQPRPQTKDAAGRDIDGCAGKRDSAAAGPDKPQVEIAHGVRPWVPRPVPLTQDRAAPAEANPALRPGCAHVAMA